MLNLEDVENGRVYAGVVAVEVVVLGIIGVAVFFEWIPLVIAAALLIMNGVILAAVFNLSVADNFDISGFNIPEKRDRQLSDPAAAWLIWFHLLYNEEINVAEDGVKEKGSEPVVTGPEDDEPRRIYIYRAERKNMNEEVAFLMDLEQEIDIDILDRRYDFEALKGATENLESTKLIRSSEETDFDEAVEEKKKALGQKIESKIRVTENDDGSVTREFPSSMRKFVERGG